MHCKNPKWLTRLVAINVLALVLGLDSDIQANGGNLSVIQPTLTETHPPTPQDLDITIEPSRSSPAAGQEFGIVVGTTNKSTHPIYLNEHYFLIAFPPELRGPNRDWYRYCSFPTEYHYYHHPEIHVTYTLKLLPQQTYDVLCNFSVQPPPEENEQDNYNSVNSVSDPNCKVPLGKWQQDKDGAPPKMITRWWERKQPEPGSFDIMLAELRSFILFPPGDYQISVLVGYWSDDTEAPYCIDSSPPPEWGVTAHAESYIPKTQNIHVSVPQFVILVGAALGGLLAFVVPLVRKSGTENEAAPPTARPTQPLTTQVPTESPSYVWIGRLNGNIALAITLTILLSRMSEAQGSLNIVASDFWGGVAVGFVANYFGPGILRAFLPSAERDANYFGPGILRAFLPSAERDVAPSADRAPGAQSSGRPTKTNP